MNGGNQLFKYDSRTKQIVNLLKKMCIEAVENTEEMSIKLQKCDENLKTQKWIFTTFINQTAIQDWHKSGRPFKNNHYFYWD